MKITPKDYATSLLQAIKGKKDGEADIIVGRFVDVLAKNNDLSKESKIIDYFSFLWNKENKIVESEITTARIIDAGLRNSLKDLLIKISRAEKVEMIEKVDKDILGGVIIKYDDRVLDGSLKTKVKNLNNAIKI